MKHSINLMSRALLFGMLLNFVPSPALLAKETKKKHKKTCVDYIVIGSCAGAVTAKRLTDDKKTSVLLLEQGDTNNTDPIIQGSPFALIAANVRNPEAVYQGQNALQPQLNNGFFSFINARISGGGSSHNGCQVVYGSTPYWQKVANIVGDEWSPANVYARYKDLESYITTVPGDTVSASRGTNGPWENAKVPSRLTENAEYLLKAYEAVSGLPRTNDYNAYNDPNSPQVGPFGHWDMQLQHDNLFLRESAAFAFLGSDVVDSEGHGVNGRKLEYSVRSMVLSLIWDEEITNKVIGVRYTRNGELFEAFAREEVIVAAGVLSAPFLQRNGIGPVDVLNNAFVTVRVPNENVGKMVNHVGVPSFFAAAVVDNEGIATPVSFGINTPGEEFAVFAPGAFLPASLPVTAANPEREMQWITIDLDQPTTQQPGLLEIFPVLDTPKSIGTINIQNDDPTKIPLYDNNYLALDTPEDIEAIVTAMQTGLNGLNNYFATNTIPVPAATPTTQVVWQLVSPDLSVLNDNTPDGGIRAFIRNNLAQAFHYSQSTAMGPDIATSVVDAHGRVHGVEGLRVADVSILPIIPDGNTCSPAILVGWTIAEFIKAEQAIAAKKSRKN